MAPPKAWGNPSRIVTSDFIVTDPPLAIYHDVLKAEAPDCARLTHAKHGGTGAHGGEPGDDDRIVWTMHLGRDRLPRLEELVPRWQGCASVSIWVCTADDWEYFKAWHAETQERRNSITFHAVIGHGAYPYNVMRNVALAPFAPWAAGKGMPRPWVVVSDADGVPSAGESTFSEILKGAVAGTNTHPHTLSEIPPILKTQLDKLGLTAPPLRDATLPAPTPGPASLCDSWDGHPQPMQCEKSGRPSGLGWARRDSTSHYARQHSRCGKKVSETDTFFVIPSFDTHGRNTEILDGLRAIPGDDKLGGATAFAYLRALSNANAVEVQAQEGYPPSYVAMVPWPAWNSDEPSGAFPVHYSFIYEPYFIAKTPFISTSYDKWEPFDEFFREPGYDKCTFFVETAALPRGVPGHMDLVVLPFVYLLNVQGSGGPRPSRHMNWER
jgi:hypothetical protein